MSKRKLSASKTPCLERSAYVDDEHAASAARASQGPPRRRVKSRVSLRANDLHGWRATFMSL